MTTPRGSPELTSGQAVPETTVNEQIRRTEGGSGYYPVANRVTAPPGSCVDGAQYLIIATATGAFTGKENQIAQAVGTNAASGWYYRVPGTKDEGIQAYDQTGDTLYQWSGTAWAIPSSSYTDEMARDAIGAALTEGAGIDIVVNDGADTITLTVDPSEVEATTTEMWTGASSAKVVTPKIAQDAMVPTALTSGTTVTPDFNAGASFTLTLAHNATLANPSNLQAGDSGAIAITQDGTGSRTMAYGNKWKFPGGSPVLSTAAGSVDLLTYWAPSTSVIYATLTKAYS